MLARLVLGAVTAGAMVVPALAGMMNADEARKFVAGKVFAFTCFDGTRGAGRIMDDLGAAGSAFTSDLIGSSLALSTAGVSTRADISAREDASAERVAPGACSERGRATARAISICWAPW